ncbi:MAG: hypothetical protein Q8L41_15675 [Anaerolineales bacterium]|nr:hypothetical protein [Anaerolineales bacterium]
MTNGQRGLDIIPREENNQTIIELGLTRKNIEKEILELTAQDYCSGPEEDHTRPGVIWKFGKNIMQREIYIKLKIAEIGSEKIAKCISFHKANHRINYPLKN